MKSYELRERLASAFQAEVRPGRMRLGAHGDTKIDAASAYELADIAVGVVARRAVQARASEIVREVERRCGGRFSPTDQVAMAEVVAEVIEEHIDTTVVLEIDHAAEFAAGRCPDGGDCNHSCREGKEPGAAFCRRVIEADEPASIASWGRWWPSAVTKAHHERFMNS